MKIINLPKLTDDRITPTLDELHELLMNIKPSLVMDKMLGELFKEQK